jgi:hypothetical protein
MEALFQQLLRSIKADQQIGLRPHTDCTSDRLLVCSAKQRQGANDLHESLVEQDDAIGLVRISPHAGKSDDVLAKPDPPNGIVGWHQSEQLFRQTQPSGICDRTAQDCDSGEDRESDALQRWKKSTKV